LLNACNVLSSVALAPLESPFAVSVGYPLHRHYRSPVTTSITMVRQTSLVWMIKAIRFYTARTPFQRGRWRLAALLHACAERLPREYEMAIRSKDGRSFRIAPSDRQYHMGLLECGLFEPELTALVRHRVQQGHVAIDAGANFGWFTTLLSRLVGESGSVHAFEPVPATAAVLRENCRLNGCSNVVVNQCALGEQEREADIYSSPRRASGDASFFPGGDNSMQPSHCRVTSLDDYYEEYALRRCDFIKCDVEGAELMFLRGAAKVLESFRPEVLIEINPAMLSRAGASGAEVLEQIQRRGDYLFEIVDTPQAGVRIVPADCRKFKSYTNVLCSPRGMPLPDESNEVC
jgi:FkbM family methyltransferase